MSALDSRTSACVFLRERVGLETHRFEALVLKLGDPEAIWDASPEALFKTEVLTDQQLGLLVRGRQKREQFEQDLLKLAQTSLQVVSCFDSDYPAGVLTISHPPSYFYRRGTEASSGAQLQVAGATEADASEISAAVVTGKQLASLGVMVISNLTEGLETATHVGALSGAGPHRVFLPCGHHTASEWDSASVLAQVAEAGAVYSEYAPATLPNVSRRSEACRLALGTAQGVLVLGRLDAHITAAVTAATTAGKPVFYMAGGDPVESEVLRKEGAYPVAGAESLDRILPLL